MQLHSKDRRVAFGQFVADLRSGELHCEGRKIHLQDQPFQVLAVLLDKAGELVTRDELRSQVWPSDTFLEFDHALNTAIKKIRIALSDDAVSPSYIQTIPKRGYRWIAPVTVCEAGVVDPPRPEKAWPGKAQAFAWGIVLALMATSLLPAPSRVVPNPPVTMAIVSSLKPSTDPALELLEEGIALQVAGRLAQLASNVQIVESTELARTLPIDNPQTDPASSVTRFTYVVHLGLQGTQQHVQTDVELIRTRGGMRIWQGRIDHARAEPLHLEADLAREIASQVVRHLPEIGR
jgi:DNA-binding winged helix-turn-helix (wHTH) protein/TolB-like protein